MKMLNEFAILLCNLLGTSQNYHAEQQNDGTYRKKLGMATPSLICRSMENEGSLAFYQKNVDSSVRWVCYDFDITKGYLDDIKLPEVRKELNLAVQVFCQSLQDMKIPYLLENSGNRGFHVWVTFSENLSYLQGYNVQQAILDKVELQLSSDRIAIDLFPSTKTPSDGVGLGVKIPLSRHKKTSCYSYLLTSLDEIELGMIREEINEELLSSNIAILKTHTSLSLRELESSLNVFLSSSQEDFHSSSRVRNIKIQKDGFSIEELKDFWSSNSVFSNFCDRIFSSKKINNEERKLLVGLFGNLECKNIDAFGNKILHSIFENTSNYNFDITNKAIKSLSSFYFPSQNQIERVLGLTFSENLKINELINQCIPKYLMHQDATLDISRADIEVTRIAELNYLLINDEAQSRVVLSELSGLDAEELLINCLHIDKNNSQLRFYKHNRKEDEKNRVLFSLGATERVYSSSILKQFIYFLQFEPSINSLGYRVNKGFSGGYIFERWLYLWIEFISNIDGALKDKTYQEFFIVKTDITKFYDKIPHDKLKRMLLGGVNSKIDLRRDLLSDDSEVKYKSFVEFIFHLSEEMLGSNVGLPQGPAYARFLAEIYLDNIDTSFDDKLRQGDVLLYQRYVDDIFFVVKSHDAASGILADLRSSLELLGLELNTDKTIVAPIKNFSEDFNKYRSQSKYAVDRVSKNFTTASDSEQNVAISEFMSLVQSDSSNDDLSFIFSHLNGVEILDKYKREKVMPTIIKGVGRGAMFKNLFTFVLDNPANYEILKNFPGEFFNEIQSEVLTSVFITAFENYKSQYSELLNLFNEIKGKLVSTRIVDEHLSYIAFLYNKDFDLNKIEPEIIIKVLSIIQTPENINFPDSLIQHLNITLNNIKSLSYFVQVMFPLCVSNAITSKGLNDLASVFYAKLSSEEQNGSLKITQDTVPEINTAATGLKYYYLLCLFSASNKNTSHDLLKSLWKYCAHIHNTYDIDSTKKTIPNWFKKIKNIEMDNAICQFIISSIVDGNIFRGLEDYNKIFERFHTLLLIYFSFKETSFDVIEIGDALDLLKDKAIFYQWLVDRDNVKLFPESRIWFERNVIENDIIFLIKGSEILIRRPTKDFSKNSQPNSEHNGYSEVVEPYDSTNYGSLKESLSGLDLSSRLDKLIILAEICDANSNFPNIFCKDRVISTDTLRPFTHELLRSNNIIFEDDEGRVTSLENNRNNFIQCFLRVCTSDNKGFIINVLTNQYINNLDPDVERFNFIKTFKKQIVELNNNEDLFSVDIAAGASLYLSLAELHPIKRLDKFVNIYHKFNPEHQCRHLYAIGTELVPSDETPLELLEVVEKSLSLIRNDFASSLSFYLDKDVINFRDLISEMISSDENINSLVTLENFQKAFIKISITSGSIIINSQRLNFTDVRIINPTTMENVQLDERHAPLLNSADHVYVSTATSIKYIIIIPSSISKIFHSISERLKQFKDNSGSVKNSYPEMSFDNKKIISIPSFNEAAHVVSTHRNINYDESTSLLAKWIHFLPRSYHEPLLNLIASHQVMTKNDVEDFHKCVSLLIGDKKSNPFLIKDVRDYNGTHRILYMGSGIGRKVSELSPFNIADNSDIATVIVDNIISGSQLLSSLKYYTTGEGYNKKSCFFPLSDLEKEELQIKLKKLKILNICTVLYTQKAFDKIKEQCKLLLNKDIEVVILNGRDIDQNAFFGSTEKIGEADKEKIRNLLMDKESMKELYFHLSISSNSPQQYFNDHNEINQINLIARYQSLPKKSFRFLCSGLKHDPSCHPLIRILEVGE
ncbi:UNVERIFIED_ORG: hypothetical protein M2402_000791 [Rahnella aquatilis]